MGSSPTGVRLSLCSRERAARAAAQGPQEFHAARERHASGAGARTGRLWQEEQACVQGSVGVRPHLLTVADGAASARAAASRARYSQARRTLKRVLACGPFHILTVQESIARVVVAHAAARPCHCSPVPEKLTSARDDRGVGRPSFAPRHDTIPYQIEHSKTRHAQEKPCTAQVMHRTRHARTSESMDPIATH